MLRYFGVLIGLVVAAPAVLVADNGYLQELIQKANDSNLSANPEWHALMHYKPRVLLPGVKSLADDPAFFNAADGKHNPRAELAATLKSFFSSMKETDKLQNPQCQFISRYHWLKQQLDFDPRRLPEQPCKRFKAWRMALAPHELTLVFPASYVNNPASMFGHTLLRVDTKDQDERTRLLAYTLSYAAATTEENGIVFAIKGLSGGYPGVFSTTPYYLKVTDYNDVENRDVWEYRLNFTPEEIDRLLMHAWELGSVYFRYYFLDENCSYHLLSLLDVARPGLRLTDEFPWWAIPSDTVRVMMERPGMLKDVVYRPARSTIIRHRLAEMSVSERKLTRAIADTMVPTTSRQFTALPEERRASMLELAFEFVDYQRLSGDREQKEAARHLLTLLGARSKLKVVEKIPDIPVPATRPEAGHRSGRVSIGYGERDRQGFQEIGIRPAYHDLMDPEDGYVRGAQIDFTALTFRHYIQTDKTKLENFTLIEIASLSPRNRFLRPTSWKVNVSRTRKHFPGVDDILVNRLNGGAGLSFEPFANTLVFGIVETTLETSGHYQDHAALGLGPELGLFTDIGSRWRIGLSGNANRFVAGETHTTYRAGLEQRIKLTNQSVLRFDLNRRREFDYRWNEGVVSLQAYF